MIKAKTNVTRGIVLKVTPFKESSAIITLGYENGLLSLNVNSIYKNNNPNKALLIVGNIIDVEYKNISDVNIVSSISLVLDISSLLLDYSSSCFLLYLQEVSLSLFSYGDKYPINEVKYLLSFLKDNKNVLAISLKLIGVFYQTLGINLEVHKCVTCSNNVVNTYSISLGGYLCDDCASKNFVFKKDKMDLYVLKYCFLKIDEDSLKKEVPLNSGIRVFNELNQYLISYFDLKEFKTQSMFTLSIN